MYTLYIKGMDVPILTLSEDNKLEYENNPVILLLDQIDRGIASEDNIICMKDKKQCSVKELIEAINTTPISPKKRQRLSEHQKDVIRALHDRGFTQREIAERTSISRGSVNRVIVAKNSAKNQ